jgi:hypothetical protein
MNKIQFYKGGLNLEQREAVNVKISAKDKEVARNLCKILNTNYSTLVSIGFYLISRSLERGELKAPLSNFIVDSIKD